LGRGMETVAGSSQAVAVNTDGFSGRVRLEEKPRREEGDIREFREYS